MVSGKILRRCTICKKFHASYLVEAPQRGSYYLCYTCWRTTQIPATFVSSEPDVTAQIERERGEALNTVDKNDGI